jgi:hypothetical protein
MKPVDILSVVLQTATAHTNGCHWAVQNSTALVVFAVSHFWHQLSGQYAVPAVDRRGDESMRTFRKVLRFALLVSLALVGPSYLLAQDSPKQDLKNAGHETKEAAKDTGRATKHAAKKTGRAVKKGTNKAAEKTEEGAQKVKDKTDPH